ncbi:branched-chain amino acid ABC transporter substrate-binding protein [Brevibacillus laterosporus]|uniref:Branched-chain amino acid ABC transporter substrate-binding protein n=1 Tax=Brevibacillus laterosporus TaxID=1465 RepID=A0A502J4H8_BRELA|nr:branched-chain amino acid ABC transporter substrate-binding protein [Brevibacillus laterosporus]QDX94481.1 branched-chain amino acid ABC transporter substrate-binding protein [Brevibacillus laterosporus]TPG68370.1 branched-chain amino acid ABC transporter substrate-binding protein [Brevibacillus laterosporus]TPG92944.1 branched-chain amino acid ABC transporter substrate-binding protein [Brevibacillus laterosporus]
MKVNKKSLALVSSILLAGAALSGCAGGNNASSGGTKQQGGGEGGSTAAGGDKIVIALVGPLSGSASDYGDSAKAGAEYALKLKQKDLKDLGFNVELKPLDDQAEPKQGVVNAQMAINDNNVLAVVGHVTTGSSLSAVTAYEKAGLVMVSPSTTGPDFTEGGKKVAHRICARDDQQGSKAAIYAKNTLNVKNAMLIHDKQAYGQGLAQEVKKQFETDGVSVVGFEGLTAGEKDYSAVVNQVMAKKPEMIYFGGYYAEAGILIKQLRDKGFTGVFMGADGLDSVEMFKIAGPAAEGVVFTSTVGDVAATEDGKKWIQEFESSTGKKLGIFTSFGYDAMAVAINGIEEAAKANGNKKPTRAQVLEAIHKTQDFKGQFVNVSFDDKGDNKNAQVFIYKYAGGSKKFEGEAK